MSNDRTAVPGTPKVKLWAPLWDSSYCSCCDLKAN